MREGSSACPERSWAELENKSRRKKPRALPKAGSPGAGLGEDSSQGHQGLGEGVGAPQISSKVHESKVLADGQCPPERKGRGPVPAALHSLLVRATAGPRRVTHKEMRQCGPRNRLPTA